MGERHTRDSAVEGQKRELGDISMNNSSPVFRCQFRIHMTKNRETLRPGAKILKLEFLVGKPHKIIFMIH